MKHKFNIGEIVTVSTITGCYEGRVDGYELDFHGEIRYKVNGHKPKPFVTITSDRLINQGDPVGLYSKEKQRRIETACA